MSDDTDAAGADTAATTASRPEPRTVVVCCDRTAHETADESGKTASASSPAADVANEDDDTTSTQMRHWLTNDILAGFLHLTLVAVVLAAGLGYLDLAAIPARMRLVFLGTVLSATVWSFGEDVLQSIRGS